MERPRDYLIVKAATYASVRVLYVHVPGEPDQVVLVQ